MTASIKPTEEDARVRDVVFVRQEFRRWDDGLYIGIGRLRELLAEHGLHLVTDADKRVLETMGKAKIGKFPMTPSTYLLGFQDRELEHNVCRVELARRGEKA